MTRGREGVWIPFKSDDVIYEMPLSTTIPFLLLGQINVFVFLKCVVSVWALNK